MKMKPKSIINIAKQFSRTPLGRYYADSSTSGQKFRELILAPAFRDFENVVVELDGTEGYGSSFLEEAFGGLVRHHGFRRVDLPRLVLISEEDESVPVEITGYITDQLKNSEKAR